MSTDLERCTADEHVLDGRKLDVKRAVPRDQAPAPVRAIWGGTGNGPQKQFNDIKKIFAGGLPPSVTEAAFRQYFEGFGEVTDAVVMMDRTTGRSRGFGFITFASDQVKEGEGKGDRDFCGGCDERAGRVLSRGGSPIVNQATHQTLRNI